MGEEHIQLELSFSTTDYNMYAQRDHHYTDTVYDSDNLPFRTLSEYERHYYITNQPELHSLWLMVSDLEDALTVSAQLQ